MARVEVLLPQWGMGMSEGTILNWHKAVGDSVSEDEPLAEIEAEKVEETLEAPATGTISEILVPEGETVDVGTVLARIEVEGSEALGVGRWALEDGTDAKPNGGKRYSPVVARMAAQHDLDLEAIKGTGRQGRVTKKDVLAFLEHADEAPMHIESPYRPEPEPQSPTPKAQSPKPGALSRMRRSIGEHMKRSLETAATCTTWIEADMSRIEAGREQLGLTALPLVARCAIAALREHPQLNAWLEGEAYTVHDAVHLGIAVSLGDEGLIVPVIHDAQELSAEGLGRRIKDAAKRARSGELHPDEVRGGTFTITNPGQYGSIMATPVINQPQVAILDLEAVVKRPVVIDDAIAIRPMTIFGLSWDHRALDGVLAAQFLASLRRHVEAWDGG